jgi:hypothetical protein
MDSLAQTGEIDYPEKVVAYLDILGFRSLVVQSRDQAKAVILKLDSCLSHSLECFSAEGGPDWFSAKLFSDCFCISCADSGGDLFLMLDELSFLQWNLATQGIFIRGGLSYGPHYENERIIFSEGLIRAYELQSLDPYPRVLIDPVLAERIKGERLDHYRKELLPYVLKGQDSVLFLDYLHGMAEMSSLVGNLDETLEMHRNAIIEQVALNRSSPRVLAKYRWLADYHNFKFAELYDREDWVEGYFEELRDRLLIPSSAFPSFERVPEGEEAEKQKHCKQVPDTLREATP